MKNLGTFLFIIAILTSCSGDLEKSEINEQIQIDQQNVFENNISYTVDGKLKEVSHNDLKNKWENELSELGHTTNLNNFEIIESEANSEGETAFYLIASNDENTIQIGSKIEKSDSSFILAEKTCICVGCPNGCELTVFVNKCRCSPCFPSDGPCEKTEKVVIEG